MGVYGKLFKGKRTKAGYHSLLSRIFGKEVSMAKISISYNCGCGFKSDNIAEAALHSDKMGHSLTVVGTITKEKEPEKKEV